MAGGATAPPNADRVAALLPLLDHRGPDDRGVSVLGGAAFGHTRLSILGVAATAARQPVNDGRHMLSFNGEIYNFQALAKELQEAGHSVGGDSDTEVLFACLSLWGVERTLARLDGMFAFAWYDAAEETLCLARDPIGEKPVYWAARGQRIWFGSEIKVLLATGEVDPAPNLARIDDYLYTGKVNGAATLFRDVHEVEPGCCAIFPRGQTRPRNHVYWSLVDHARQAIDASDPGALATRLEAAIGSRRISDVPVGVLLSGGIDSNTLAEFLCQAKPDDSLDFYFADNSDPARSERPDVDLFFDHLTGRYPRADLRLHSNLVGFDDYQARLAELTWHYDEPVQFANSPLLLGLCANARRDGIKVMLSGEGSDELFHGYARFARTLADLDGVTDRRAILEALYFGGGLHSVDDVRRLTAGVADGAEATEPWRWLDAQLDAFPVDRLQLLFSQRYRLQTLLQRQDRVGMAESIEIRVPFLAPWFVAWVNGIPIGDLWNADSGVTKKCLREVMSRRLPDRILTKPKDGFPSDMLTWLREDRFAPVVTGLVGDPDGFTQTYLDGGFALRILGEHFSGERRRDVLVWELYALELWHRQFAEGAIAQPIAASGR